MTIFEYLAHTAPSVLLALEGRGLMAISDYLPASTASLMTARAYKRIHKRLRQVRAG